MNGNGIVAGVTGINCTDNPGPGVAVARSLKEAAIGIRMVGLGYDVNDPGHYLPQYIDRSYMLPYPTKGWNEIKKSLTMIKEDYGLNCLVPCLDVELPLFIRHQDELEEMGIRAFLPTKEQFNIRSKDKLSEVAEKIGVYYPETIAIQSTSEIENAGARLGWPLVVKGCYYKAYIATNSWEAIRFFNEISAEWGFPVLLQKRVVGEEVNVVGLGDGEGGLMGMLSAKKQTTTHLGKIWTGVTIKHEKLTRTAENFVKAYQWRGPFELECVSNGDDLCLIEINPRFPAWVYFATALGVNLPHRLLLKMHHRNYPVDSFFEPGKMFVRHTSELVCDMSTFINLVTRGTSHV